jgi:hypothetical protein
MVDVRTAFHDWTTAFLPTRFMRRKWASGQLLRLTGAMLRLGDPQREIRGDFRQRDRAGASGRPERVLRLSECSIPEHSAAQTGAQRIAIKRLPL